MPSIVACTVRIIRELPAEAIEEVRLGKNAVPSTLFGKNNNNDNNCGFNLGQRVQHAKFGEGVILNLEGTGDNTRIQVNFEQVGSKWLVAAYANLQAS
jgi:DNA helicase-2/ATP-dependent DNA helicase PcrA